MDVEKKYKLAIGMFNEGKNKEALELLLLGYPEVKDPVLKLNYILFLITLVDPVFDMEKLLTLCDEGLKITAGAKNPAAFCYLQMRKAVCYMTKSAEMLSVKKDITLAPGRINFALESDRDLYLSAEGKIVDLWRQVDELSSSSLSLADVNNYDLQAHLHSMLGDIQSTKCSQYLLEHLRHAKLLYKLRPFGLKPRHLLRCREQRRLKKMLGQAKDHYLSSVDFYRKNNDPVGVASSFSNLSNHMRTFEFYRPARKYLALSKRASNAKSVAVKRDQLETNIKEKNKNIPDYKQELPRPVLRRNSVKNLKSKLKDWFSNIK